MTTTNTTNTTSNVVTSATQSLLTSLGTGSGVDTASLVTSLVQAQFANRTAQLTTKSDALTAQTIRPYTDLLLHDMGEALADGRPDNRADGRHRGVRARTPCS